MFINPFFKSKIPDEMPEGMQSAVDELRKSADKEECLRKSYDILSGKYRGLRIKTYTRLFELFVCDLDKIWNKTGFLHCTTLNHLMRILLVKSGFFNDSDIRIRWALVWYISLHQYLDVKISENKHISIDLWGKAHGIRFGDHAHGVH